jgi:hypothetical protein
MKSMKGFGSVVSDMQRDSLQAILKDKPQRQAHLVYNPHYLCSWSVFFSRHGTVFNDAKIWYIATGLFGVAMTSGGLLFVLVPHPQDLDVSCVFEIVLYFKVFIAFMLGLFMQRCLVRWFGCMVALTDFFLSIRKLCWLVNVNAVSPEERDAVQRLAILSCFLLENEVTSTWTEDHADREARWHRLADFLAEDALVHDHELATLEEEVEHDGRSARVWIWIGQLLHDLDGVSPPMRGTLMQLVSEATQVISEIKKYVQFQLPYMYAHMLAVFVHLTNILIALACGAAIAVSMGDFTRNWKLWQSSAYDNDTLPSGVQPRKEVYRAVQAIAVQIFILLIQPMIYQAFLEIASTLCDPFTHKDYGIPLHSHIAYIREHIQMGNELAAMDLDQIEVDYAESKKEKLARLLRKSMTQTKESARGAEGGGEP